MPHKVHRAAIIPAAKLDLLSNLFKEDLRGLLQGGILDTVSLIARFPDSLLKQKHGMAFAPESMQQDNLFGRIRIIVN
jgi:hypothetical protein